MRTKSAKASGSAQPEQSFQEQLSLKGARVDSCLGRPQRSTQVLANLGRPPVGAGLMWIHLAAVGSREDRNGCSRQGFGIVGGLVCGPTEGSGPRRDKRSRAYPLAERALCSRKEQLPSNIQEWLVKGATPNPTWVATRRAMEAYWVEETHRLMAATLLAPNWGIRCGPSPDDKCVGDPAQTSPLESKQVLWWFSFLDDLRSMSVFDVRVEGR
eukprot:scaffold167667_cov31-Tisochrysis_lutea.AAC.2